MKLELTEKMQSDIAMKNIALINRLANEQEAGVTVKSLIIDDLTENGREDVAEKVYDKINETVLEFYNIASEMDAAPSNHDFLKEQLERYMDAACFSNKERFEYLSELKHSFKQLSLNVFKDSLEKDGIDPEFMQQVIDVERTAEINVANDNPISEELTALLEQTVDSFDASLLCAKPNEVSEIAATFANNKEYEDFAANLNKINFEQYEEQTLLAYSAYNVLYENGVEISEIDTRVLTVQAVSGYEQGKIITQLSKDEITAEKAVNLMGRIAAIAGAVIVGGTVAIVAGGLGAMAATAVNAVLGTSVSVNLCTAFAGATAGAATIEALGKACEKIAAKFQQPLARARQKLVSSVAASIGYTKSVVLPTITRVKDKVASFVKSIPNKTSGFISSIKNFFTGKGEEQSLYEQEGNLLPQRQG